MDQIYTLELTGKQLCLLMNCIDERVNSNNIISQHTGKSRSNENRSLRSLQRYMKNLKKEAKILKRKDEENSGGTL